MYRDAPLVSVVMPAYNAAATINTAIASVLAQTAGDLEVVVCDDASSDDTAARVRAFGDPRVRLVHNERNAGEGAARDRAIDAARGRWLAVLDADDAWAPDRLERLLEAAGSDRDVLVFDDLMICHHASGGLVPWRAMRGQHAFGARGGRAVDLPFEDYLRAERLLIKPLLPAAAVRDHGVRHAARRFGEDSEYFIRLGALGLRFRYVPRPMYLYRVMPGSATAQSAPHRMRECLEGCATFDLPEPARQALRDKIASLVTNEALYELRARAYRGDLAGCLRVLMRRPSVIAVAPRRALRHLRYQLHRVLHVGSPR